MRSSFIFYCVFHCIFNNQIWFPTCTHSLAEEHQNLVSSSLICEQRVHAVCRCLVYKKINTITASEMVLQKGCSCSTCFWGRMAARGQHGPWVTGKSRNTFGRTEWRPRGNEKESKHSGAALRGYGQPSKGTVQGGDKAREDYSHSRPRLLPGFLLLVSVRSHLVPK